MKFTLMSYHYLRYPIRKYLDKMERSPLDGLDIYCTAPQLNPFDYRLGDLILSCRFSFSDLASLVYLFR